MYLLPAYLADWILPSTYHVRTIYLKWMSLIICWAEEVTFSLSCWDRWLNTSWLSRSHGSLGTAHSFHIILHRYHCSGAEIISSGSGSDSGFTENPNYGSSTGSGYLNNCLF
jgi:hypothetical protein